MGKTSFALNLCQHLAIRQKTPVGIFSLEMSAEQLVTRLLCSEARIDSNKLRRGYLKANEYAELAIVAGYLAEAPIYIDDSPGLSTLELRAKARRLKTEANIGMLMVDYLQLVSVHERTENRQQQISLISRGMKALAKELNIPVVALSQLSRAVESRGGDKRPLLSDLRESGSIEQDSDLVLFLYRPEVYEGPESENRGKAELIIGKQRNGPTGVVKLAFIREFTRFENLAIGTG
jgi:replicative DNA helicase